MFEKKSFGTSQESDSNYPAVINHNYKPVTTPTMYNALKHLLFFGLNREREKREVRGRKRDF